MIFFFLLIKTTEKKVSNRFVETVATKICFATEKIDRMFIAFLGGNNETIAILICKQ